MGKNRLSLPILPRSANHQMGPIVKPSRAAQQRNRKTKSAPTAQPVEQRPLVNIPRRPLIMATVTGGIIGLILTQAFGWSIMQSFLYTLMFAGLAILITSVAYRTFKR